MPLFAAWRANHENDARLAQQAVKSGQLSITGVLLGDTTYGSAPFTEAYAEASGWILTPAQLPPGVPHVEARPVCLPQVDY